jgi:hypothetical protein
MRAEARQRSSPDGRRSSPDGRQAGPGPSALTARLHGSQMPRIGVRGRHSMSRSGEAPGLQLHRGVLQPAPTILGAQLIHH